MIPKFRAWDKDSKVMRPWKNLILEKDDGDDFWLIGYEESKNIVSYDHDQILMQSTGLKDKNGVEIFEGDVVKVSDGSNEEDSYISVVKNYADEGYPAFDIEAPSSWYYESNVLSKIMGGDYETIEVIGNIYENSELLEQANEN